MRRRRLRHSSSRPGCDPVAALLAGHEVPSGTDGASPKPETPLHRLSVGAEGALSERRSEFAGDSALERAAIGISPPPKKPSSTIRIGPSASSSAAIGATAIGYWIWCGRAPTRATSNSCCSIPPHRTASGSRSGSGKDPGQAGKSQAQHLVRAPSGFTVRPSNRERRQADAVWAVQLAVPRRQCEDPARLMERRTVPCSRRLPRSRT